MLNKYNQELIRKEMITEKDKEVFKKIDQIVDVFQENFKNYSKEDIIDALKSNSLNLRSTYNFLKSPESMKGNYTYIMTINNRFDFFGSRGLYHHKNAKH